MFTFLRKGKQVQMQLLQHPKHSNVDNPNNVRREASSHCSKKKENLKAKLEQLETDTVSSKISETCRETSMDLRSVTSQELI